MSESIKINFIGRKKARRLVMQALYSWIISHNEVTDIATFFLNDNKSEKIDLEYFHRVLHNVVKQVDELDQIMLPYLNRKIEELDPIEHAILLLAIYELKCEPTIPYKVVINEALELAKSFGAIESYKFVNGVLDKVAKDIRN